MPVITRSKNGVVEPVSVHARACVGVHAYVPVLTSTSPPGQTLPEQGRVNVLKTAAVSLGLSHHGYGRDRGHWRCTKKKEKKKKKAEGRGGGGEGRGRRRGEGGWPGISVCG